MRLPVPNRWLVDYSTDVDPKRLRGKFPLVILDPGCQTALDEARAAGVKVMGYCAWTEIADDSRWRKKFDDAGIKTLGRTKWAGDYIDILDPNWQAMFVGDMVSEIMVDLDWDGVFLDVFDGAVDMGNEFDFDVEAGVQAGSDAVARIREVYPKAIIVPNRGFEQWTSSRQFQNAIDGMLVERILTGEDMHWIMGQIEPVRDAGKVILALDYCADEKKAKAIVKKNKELGFVPLVTASTNLSPPRLVGFPGKWNGQ